MTRQTEEGLPGSSENSKFTGNPQPSSLSLVASTLTCLVLNRLDNLITVSCLRRRLFHCPKCQPLQPLMPLQVHFSISLPESQVQCPSPLSLDFSSNVVAQEPATDMGAVCLDVLSEEIRTKDSKLSNGHDNALWCETNVSHIRGCKLVRLDFIRKRKPRICEHL